MILLELKRLNIPLDRDVIFLAEAGEEGSTQFGIEFMVNEHFSEIDAEFCLAEAGRSSERTGASGSPACRPRELPRAIEVISKGTAGHAARPQN